MEKRSRLPNLRRRTVSLVAAAVSVYVVGAALPLPAVAADLASLSLEELMEVEVTTVTKKPQLRAEVPAAIFVLSNDDIRRSGVTNIPDALRLVPGVHVARIDANRWAISIRGFNGRFTNKLLVLIDGRSVYTPLFGGVYWEEQDTLLEDIERIEVIRGPGGAVWGANAVNGVINVITKSAKDTRGGFATVGGGNEEQGFAAVRYGKKLGAGRFARIYAKMFRRDGGGGGDAYDDWTVGRVGFRSDLELDHQTQFLLHGDGYYGELGQRYLPYSPDGSDAGRAVDGETQIAGGYLLARWGRELSADSRISLQGHIDARHRNEDLFRMNRTSVDLSFEHRMALVYRQDLVYGFGYRLDADDFDGSPSVSLDPDNRSVNLFSAFVHDEVWVYPDVLQIAFGAKIEHNDYTGFEFQPSVSALTPLTPQHTVWLSLSRAVRTPSRAENDVEIPLNVTFGGIGDATALLLGNTHTEAENLLALELGYRGELREDLYLDLSVFLHDYDELITLASGLPATGPNGPVVPVQFVNEGDANVYGFEVAGGWQPRSWWRTHAAYSLLQSDTDSADAASPKHQASLRSMVDIGERWELDMVVRYVDSLRQASIGSYVAIDARVAYRVSDDLRLELVGRDLVEDEHREFEEFLLNPESTTVERSFYASLNWRF